MSDMRKLVVHFDGASRGNPGPAAIGVVISTPVGETILELGEAIGEATNNHAEYTALIRALEETKGLGALEVECFSDSELVVRQITGIYRVKSKALLPLAQRAQALRQGFEAFSISHIRRSLNKRADELASEAVKTSDSAP